SDLRCPGSAWLAVDPGDVDASGFELDDEHHEVAYERADGQRLDGEEIRRRNLAPMRPEERLPGHGFASDRSGLDAMFLESSLDGGPPKVKTEVVQCTAQPRVAPRGIVASHREELLDGLAARPRTARPRAPGRPVVLGSYLLAVPPEDSVRS